MTLRLRFFFALLALAGSAGAQNQLLHLEAPDASAGDRFGWSVAVNGERIVVGAVGDDDPALDSGSAYVYDGTNGQLLFKVVPSHLDASDRFGEAVAVAGPRLFVGAPGHDDLGTSSGSVFAFDLATGQELYELHASDGAANDYFGYSLSLAGTYLVVGAPFDDDNGSDSGSAYVFDVATGQQLFKLIAADAVAGDRFGESVGASAGLAVIGAPYDDPNGQDTGSAYLFDLANGQQTLKYVPSPQTIAPFDKFGEKVAISGGVAIGAKKRDANGVGSAFVFDPQSGEELFILRPSGGGTFLGHFGSSVAIRGNRLVVGAEWTDGGGAAYLFSSCGQLFTRVMSDDPNVSELGFSAAISNDRAIVGAPESPHPHARGYVYVYSLPMEVGSPFCFGDDSGTPCPCNNSGGVGEGCENGFGAGGVLSATGTPSVAVDDLRLNACQLALGQTCLFFQGDVALNGGNGFPFGDGLRCVGGNVQRLEICSIPCSGPGCTSATHTTIPLAAAGGVSAGDLVHYQCWYRDPTHSPCMTGFNLSNGLDVTWTP